MNKSTDDTRTEATRLAQLGRRGDRRLADLGRMLWFDTNWGGRAEAGHYLRGETDYLTTFSARTKL
jgi:hypothetical protein